jgi:cytochrome c-type biogenesis protein CcmF
VLVTNGQELVSGIRAARRSRSAGAIRRGSRRYGGLLVHVGLAVLATGIIASSGFAQQAEVTLVKGESVAFAGFSMRYDGLTTEQQPQRTVLTTHLRVTRPSGDRVGLLEPRLNVYPAASEPIGSPSIDRGVVWDMYASVIGLQGKGRSATFRLYRNPGVNWMWLGALLMVLGGATAGLPRRTRRRPSVSVLAPEADLTPDPVGAL